MINEEIAFIIGLLIGALFGLCIPFKTVRKFFEKEKTEGGKR